MDPYDIGYYLGPARRPTPAPPEEGRRLSPALDCGYTHPPPHMRVSTGLTPEQRKTALRKSQHEASDLLEAHFAQMLLTDDLHAPSPAINKSKALEANDYTNEVEGGQAYVQKKMTQWKELSEAKAHVNFVKQRQHEFDLEQKAKAEVKAADEAKAKAKAEEKAKSKGKDRERDKGKDRDRHRDRERDRYRDQDKGKGKARVDPEYEGERGRSEERSDGETQVLPLRLKRKGKRKDLRLSEEDIRFWR